MLKQAGLSVALVTGASGSRIEQSLGRLCAHIIHRRDKRDDVMNAKAHPEPYPKAAKALGAPPPRN